MLTQHDYSDPRMCLAQEFCRADAFVCARRGHADIGDDYIRLLAFHGDQQLVEIATRCHQLEPVLRL